MIIHFYLTSKLANSEICWIFKCLFFYPLREAVSNFLTALSLQRKSRNQQQVPHPAISGNIWAALRIALSLMDQPELFQAANLGDLDVLLRAFNLDPWRKRGGGGTLHLCNCTEKCKTILLWIPKKKDKNGCSKGHGDITQGNSHRQCPVSVQIQKAQNVAESSLGSKERRDTRQNQDKVTVFEYASQAVSTLQVCSLGFFQVSTCSWWHMWGTCSWGTWRKQCLGSGNSVSELSSEIPPFYQVEYSLGQGACTYINSWLKRGIA